MQQLFAKIALWLQKNEKKALLSGIFALTLALFALGVWKYAIFAYNGIDLAYFNQVFWNTVHGRPFVQSIHPHLSLGDHAEFALLGLALPYALWQDPRMLLLLQALALAACAWPLWRIARFRFAAGAVNAATAGASGASVTRWLPLAFAAAFLLNPAIQNIAAFEFHVLAFAAFPLFMAAFAYETGSKRNFLLWCLAALLVREDVAMVVAMFGALAWMERRALWWRVTPAVLGAAWFVTAMKLIAHFAPDGAYKFRVYYAWLGDTPWQMLTAPFTKPLALLQHLLTLPNLEMALGFLMPFALLPLLKPRRLVLLIGPLLQVLLGAPGGGAIVTETHYATLFMPALALAAIDGLASVTNRDAAAAVPRWMTWLHKAFSIRGADGRQRNVLPRPQVLAPTILLFCALYGTAALGPLPSFAWRLATDHAAWERAATLRSVADAVPADASVISSYALLPALSSRERLTSAHYVVLGVTQFAERPYAPPADARYLALDTDDLLTWRTQFSKTSWASAQYPGWQDRLRAVMGVPVLVNGGVALYDTGALGAMNEPLPLTLPPADESGMTAAATTEQRADGAYVRFETDLGWWPSDPSSVARYTVKDAAGRTVLDETMPVDAPMPWTSRNGGTRLRFAGRIPDGARWPLQPEVAIENVTYGYGLNAVRSPVRSVSASETVKVLALPELKP